MQKSENTFMRVMDIFTHFLLLNVIWMVSCLLIVTIFPATTALFAVARKWTASGIEAGVFTLYIDKFKENFRKSFVIGLISIAAGAVIYMDAVILLHVSFKGSMFLLALLIFAGMLYFFTVIYVFFMMVNYELSILHTLKNALFLSISKIFHTLSYLAIIAGVLTIVYFFPFFLLIAGSLQAFIMYQIFHRLTDQINQPVTE
ncbi:YesL family protein [Sediminibacillus albus]|uniref:Uncharacterized membrane protein YesL n=1 Tax=Sediminibacillus albus TaxID=407036 RepID=A0A1G8YIW0_9BACI|nr:DUF624 domain-containing protein [Sediminibacillus albus]SDK02686.1 Uncharacterized membrane protein YesL [Sediminibacillus albus]